MDPGLPTLPPPSRCPAPGLRPDAGADEAFAPALRPGPGQDEPLAPPPHRGSFVKRRLAPIAAAVLAFLTKIKIVLLLLPKVKLLATAGTMAVSVVAYATIWGYQFALGFVVLLLVHEMGHVIALRREGIKATAP